MKVFYNVRWLNCVVLGQVHRRVGHHGGGHCVNPPGGGDGGRGPELVTVLPFHDIRDFTSSSSAYFQSAFLFDLSYCLIPIVFVCCKC